MNKKTYEVEPTPISFRQYWLAGVFLALAFLAPITTWLFWGWDADLLARSGSLTVFFAAVAQFTTLNRTNKKHILNACRARAGETPKALSLVVKIVGAISLILGLLGTLLWGYGDWAICSWQHNCEVCAPDTNIESTHTI